MNSRQSRVANVGELPLVSIISVLRIPHMFRETVEEEIETMLEEGVIEPSNSEWASPMVIIKKKDDTLRLCVDYRKLNAITELDAYPIPRFEDILDQVGQARYISTLDLAKGSYCGG